MSQGNNNLREVAALFLKLGCIGFGGPAVHIAMMEREVVQKRKWMSPEYFLDLVGATNLIPGPNSTEMTMHCGQLRAGWKGLIVAGFCFIMPAVILTGLIAWAYQVYGKIPWVASFVDGMKPATLAVLVFLMLNLGKKALKSLELGVLGVAALVLALLGVNEIWVLFGAGFAALLWQEMRHKNRMVNGVMPFILLQISALSWSSPAWKMFWIFLKVGSILYGSGYVLFAFLDAELVGGGYMDKTTLLDAIAVGQFTPGPVFSAATFIGWQIAGFQGAVAATIGIFLPAFVFVAFLQPIIPRLRASVRMSTFLDAVNMASVALILAVCLQMGAGMVTDWRMIAIAAGGFVALWVKPDLNTAYVVLAGGLINML